MPALTPALSRPTGEGETLSGQWISHSHWLNPVPGIRSTKNIYWKRTR